MRGGERKRKEGGAVVEHSSVLGARIRSARGLWRENVAVKDCGIDREVCLNFLQSDFANGYVNLCVYLFLIVIHTHESQSGVLHD